MTAWYKAGHSPDESPGSSQPLEAQMTTGAGPAPQLERHAALRHAWEAEREAARAARRRGDESGEWRHLERAHIVSQPMAWRHISSHAAMLRAAVRRGDQREIVGQLLRLLLAAPGSLTGRYPVGNTGGADVSAFRPMPVPEDLRPLLNVEDAA
jgi:hypothetical protein